MQINLKNLYLKKQMIIKEPYEYQIGTDVFQGVICYDNDIQMPLPGVLVSHQYTGCSKLEERKCEFLAKAGYFAFAVDLYGKGIRGKTPDESLDLMNQLSKDRKLLAKRINYSLTLLKNHQFVDSKKIAAIGYCFGGRCVIDLARSGADLNLVVSFHGIYDRPNIDNPKNINTPILILHGDEDPYATENDLKNLLTELKEKNAKWFVHIFGGVAHAFTNPNANDDLNGLKYNRDAMHMSWKIMKNYFNRYIHEKL